MQPINLHVSVQVEKKTLCYQVAGVTEDALMNGFYVIIVQDILWKDLRCHSESGELKKTCESLGNLWHLTGLCVSTASWKPLVQYFLGIGLADLYHLWVRGQPIAKALGVVLVTECEVVIHKYRYFLYGFPEMDCKTSEL